MDSSSQDDATLDPEIIELMRVADSGGVLHEHQTARLVPFGRCAICGRTPDAPSLFLDECAEFHQPANDEPDDRQEDQDDEETVDSEPIDPDQDDPNGSGDDGDPEKAETLEDVDSDRAETQEEDGSDQDDPTETLSSHDVARKLARAGVYVFPVHTISDGRCSCGKPCSSEGKHPRFAGGHHGATTDSVVIDRWEAEFPETNFGIDLARSGIVTVAPDAPGWESMFKSRGMAECWTIRSGNGTHYHYRRPDGCPEVRLCKSKAYDILSNGYAIAPGSLHRNGRTYTEVVPIERFIGADGTLDLPVAPAWAVAMLVEKATKSAGEEEEDDDPNEPPVDLDEIGRKWWDGESTVMKPDGTVDTSSTLYQIGYHLARSGLRRHALAHALRNRDLYLGYEKYTYRGDADVQYRRIATKVCAELRGNGGGVGSPGFPGSSGSSGSSARDPKTPAPILPLDVFPPEFRTFVTEGAAAIGVPPEMVAIPALAFAAAAIGKTRRIELKPGFQQPAVLFTGVIARPGAAKSPSIDGARQPLDVLQQEAALDHALALVAYNRAVAGAKKSKGHPPDPPVCQHFYTTDATAEALVPMISHSAGLVISRDELVALVRSMDAYRKGGDRQMYLSLWTGTALKVDRKTTGSMFVPYPAVSIVGGIQPDLLPELADEKNRSDGFIDRFLLIYPDVGTRTWNDAQTSRKTVEDMTKVFRRLRDPKGYTQPVVLPLAPDALTVWKDWYNQNAVLTEEARGLAAGCYAKYPNQAARLALILHALTFPDDIRGPISADTVRGAITLIEYFRASLVRILPFFNAAGSNPTAGLAGRVRRVLDRTPGAWISRSNIHTGLGGYVRADDISAALDILKGEGLAESRTVPAGPVGGRPREEWRSVTKTAPEKPQEPDESADAPDPGTKSGEDGAGETPEEPTPGPEQPPTGPDGDIAEEHCRP